MNPRHEPLVFHFKPPSFVNTLFLDRDGVLIDPVVRGLEVSSPRSLDEIGISADISALAQPGIRDHWNLVIISNQPDLARKIINLSFVQEIHERIKCRIPVNAAYVCPHQESDACSCRKPQDGLIRKFREDFPHLRGGDYMVGDRVVDKQCALNAGIPFILRKRPYNKDLAFSAELAVKDLWGLETLLKRQGKA